MTAPAAVKSAYRDERSRMERGGPQMNTVTLELGSRSITEHRLPIGTRRQHRRESRFGFHKARLLPGISRGGVHRAVALPE